MKRAFTLLALPLALAACDYTDYPYAQGSPQDYNTIENPKVPKVSYHERSDTFALGAAGFDAENKRALASFLEGVHPLATQSLTLTHHLSEDQLAIAVRTLRAKGFKRSVMTVEENRLMPRGEIQLTLAYAEALPPRCPDWSKSNSTNYSNTNHTNMRCAQATNVSRMVANPAHLERSDGLRVAPEATNTGIAIQTYRGEIAPSTTTESTASEDSATTTTGSTGQ